MQFLIWADILGFSALPQEIAIKSGINEENARQDYLKNPILKEVGRLENEISDVRVHHKGTDDFLITCSNLDSMFKILENIIQIRIPIQSFDKIPLEIAIDYKELSETNTEVVNKSATINFFRSNLIRMYRERTQSPKTTYILLSKSVYDQLDQFDKDECSKFETDDKNFYSVSPIVFLENQKIREFLKRIKKSNHTFYNKINKLYVKPNEYANIKNTLMRKHIVLITGTKEFGKTYTAAHLLWEFYNDGYTPKWIGGNENTEMQFTRDRLSQIDQELKPKHIIYFEDPFGSTKYEATEILEREIQRIIRSIEHANDVFVVITSREEVFKEFEREKLSNINLREFERKLNIKKPSYDSKGRKEILKLYAKYRSCIWLNNTYLSASIYSEVESGNMLPTPLSLRNFAIVSKDYLDHHPIRQALEEASKETAQSFAKEIRNMDNSRKLFLAILFVSRGGMQLTRLKQLYQDLSIRLNMHNLVDFERAFAWFEDDKIEQNTKQISFSHPSYYEALGYVLSNTDHHTDFDRNLFTQVLHYMGEQGFNLEFVADAIALNYEKLPANIRERLLEKIGTNNPDRVGVYVAKCLEKNFEIIPTELRNKLIVNVSYTVNPSRILVSVLINNEKSIDKDLRDTTLLMWCQMNGVAAKIPFHLFHSLKKLESELYIKILDRIYKNNQADVEFGWYIDHYYPKINRDEKDEFLERLSMSKYYKGEAGKIILSNWAMTSPNSRQKIYSLAQSEKGSYHIVKYLDQTFEKIPSETIQKLLSLLSQSNDYDTVSGICRLLANNFTGLENSVLTSTINKIKIKDPAPGFLTELILKNYNAVDQEIRNLIFEFVMIDEYRLEILFRIGRYFSGLPSNIQNLLVDYNKDFFIFLQSLSLHNENKIMLLDVLENIAVQHKDNVLPILTNLAGDLDENIKNTAASLLKTLIAQK